MNSNDPLRHLRQCRGALCFDASTSRKEGLASSKSCFICCCYINLHLCCFSMAYSKDSKSHRSQHDKRPCPGQQLSQGATAQRASFRQPGRAARPSEVICYVLSACVDYVCFLGLLFVCCFVEPGRVKLFVMIYVFMFVTCVFFVCSACFVVFGQA